MMYIVYVYMNRKVSVASNHNFFSKVEDFSRLQAETYSVKVIVSKKWCRAFQMQFSEHFCDISRIFN